MASKMASNGDEAMRGEKSSGSDCEHTIAMTTSGNSARLGRSVARSPLFKLSAELRNTIYRLVLVEDQDDHAQCSHAISMGAIIRSKVFDDTSGQLLAISNKPASRAISARRSRPN